MKTTVSENGQITVPAKAREALRLHPGDVLDVAIDGQALKLQRMEKPELVPTKPEKVTFVREGSFLVAKSKRKVSPELLKTLLADIP